MKNVMMISFGTATTKKAGRAGHEREMVLVDMGRTAVLESGNQTASAEAQDAGSILMQSAKSPTVDKSPATQR